MCIRDRSYHEVVHEIPYRNLLVMNKDKQHPVYDGEVMEEVTEEEFFKNRKSKLNT